MIHRDFNQNISTELFQLQMIIDDFPDDCCYKINTGAPLPHFADCVIQVEDTKIVEMKSDVEKVVEILVEPSEDLDIRYVSLTKSRTDSF